MAFIHYNLTILFLVILAASLEAQAARVGQLRPSMRNYHARRAANSDRTPENIHPEGRNRKFPATLVKADDTQLPDQGTSPGSGHPSEGQNRKMQPEARKTRRFSFTAGKTDSDPLTNRGPSPGIGHLFVGQKRKMHTEGQSGHFHSEDVSTTTPGTSPGIGHSRAGQNSKMQLEGQNRHLATTTGKTDNNSPASQGTSPGIGHSREGQKGQLRLGILAPKIGK